MMAAARRLSAFNASSLHKILPQGADVWMMPIVMGAKVLKK